MNQLYPKNRLCVHILHISQWIRHVSQLKKCPVFKLQILLKLSCVYMSLSYNWWTAYYKVDTNVFKGRPKKHRNAKQGHRLASPAPRLQHSLQCLWTCVISAPKKLIKCHKKNCLYTSLILLVNVFVLLRLRIRFICSIL